MMSLVCNIDWSHESARKTRRSLNHTCYIISDLHKLIAIAHLDGEKDLVSLPIFVLENPPKTWGVLIVDDKPIVS